MSVILVLSGLLALALLIYLAVVIIKPEWFQ